jgi:RNA polymerase sigma factor (sigma-70 family)
LPVTTSSFEALYRRHYGEVLSSCRHILRSRDDAEDAAQQTFLSAYRDLARGVRPNHPKAWLYSIARNRCLEMLRSRQRATAPDPSSVPDVVEEIERRAEVRELLEDLEQLPPAQRAALALFELHALPQADIAELLGCKPGRVKALVFQARSALLAHREAREIPCTDIRVMLATQPGSATRTRVVRAHVKQCRRCADFHQAISEQGRELASARLVPLPVLALKEKLRVAIGIGQGGAASDAAATLVPQAVAVKVAIVAVAVSGVAISAQITEGGSGGTHGSSRSAPGSTGANPRPTFAAAPRARGGGRGSDRARMQPSWADHPAASTWQVLIREPRPGAPTAPGRSPGTGEDPEAAAIGAGRRRPGQDEPGRPDPGRARNERSRAGRGNDGNGRGGTAGNADKRVAQRAGPNHGLGEGPSSGGARHPSRREDENLPPGDPSKHSPLDRLDPSLLPAAPEVLLAP